MFGAALLVAAASATQDILIDAFRVESLDASEQAAGMASYVAAYRVGMLVSTAGALFIVTGFEDFGFGKELAWSLGYVTMAAFVAIGLVTALLATEPARSAAVHTEHEKHAAEKSVAARHADGNQRVLRIPYPRDGSYRTHLRRPLQVLRRLRRQMTTPFVIDLGLQPQRLRRHRQGRRVSPQR